MTSVNWNDLVRDAGTSLEPIPDGDYDFIVKDSKFKPSKDGKRMWEIKCAVENGPQVNRLVWDNLVVSPENPNALGFFFRKMAALGLNAEFFKTNPSDSQIEQALRGRRFRGTVGHRSWQGIARNTLNAYFPAAGMAPGNVPPAAAPAPAPAPAPAAPAPAPAPAAAPAPAPAAPAAPPAAAPATQSPWDQQPQQPGVFPMEAPPAPPGAPF